MSIKGKTFEELHGIKKAKELKERLSKITTNQMKLQRKGKTYIEIYGEERASEIIKKKSVDRANRIGKKDFICEYCEISFKTRRTYTEKRIRKFCSLKCKHLSLHKSAYYTCPICKKTEKVKPFQLVKKACSQKCYNRVITGKGNPNWKGGISFEPYSTDWTKELRLYIRTRDNFTCQLCTMTELESLEEMGRVLTVHHIDYDKQNCYESNLTTLCTKCNYKVNSNRDYWTNYFNNKIGELV